MIKKIQAVIKSENFIVYLLMGFAFLLPFAHLLVIGMILIILARIKEGNILLTNLDVKKRRLLYAIIFFYLLHIIGLIYTQNTDDGWFDIKTKFIFILFAFVFATKKITSESVKLIMYAHIIGLFFASLCCLINASYIYFTEQRNAFFYQDFTVFLHPAYFSLYLNFAIGWMLITLTTPSSISKAGKKILIAASIFFSGIIILLSSKLGLATLFLLYFLFALYYIFSRKKYLFGISCFAILIGAVAFIANLPYVKGRIYSAVEAIKMDNSTSKTSSESTTVRIFIWQAANKIIAQHFLRGVGTGDTKDELMKTYLEEGYTGAYAHSLNAHSQFFQEFIALGITGFIALLLILLIPLVSGITDHNLSLLVLTLLLLINFLTESMLETQAGVAFTAFFISCLGFCNTNNKLQTI